MNPPDRRKGPCRGAQRAGAPAGARARRGLDVLLGVDPALRQRVVRTLLSAVVYLSSIGAECLSVRFGFGDPLEVGWLIGYLLFGAVFFFVLVRSGWSRRLADPMMTMPQLLYAMSAIVVSYPVNGPSRGLNVLLIAVPPLFGFLAIGRRTATAIVASIPLVFGPMMFGLAWLDPHRFEPRIELVHFIILTLCISTMAVLLNQITAMRNRVRAQKGALTEALEHIEKISIRDDLTGLFNRRHLTTRLDAEVARRARDGRPFCLCLIDIDFFKRINDRHGHARGDAVLCRFAQILQAGLRDGDVLGRWGGEEFLMLLPATTAPLARDQIERLRADVLDAARWGPDAALTVRFSAGLAEDAGATASDILERADRALYSAKAGGRDRVVLADQRRAA